MKIVTFENLCLKGKPQKTAVPLFLRISNVINLALKFSRRGMYVYLIADPGDLLELPEFADHLSDRLAHNTVHIVQQDDTSLLWKEDLEQCAKSMRGIMIPNAENLSERQRQELNRFSRASETTRMVIATFPTRRHLNNCILEWPKPLRDRFAPRAIEWPALKSRRSDMDAMISWALKELTKALGHDVTISEEGKRWLINKPPKNVVALFDLIAQSALRAKDKKSSTIDIQSLKPTAPSTRPHAMSEALATN